MIPTPYGAIYACYFCWGHTLGAIATKTGKEKIIKNTHKLILCWGKETTRRIAKCLGWSIQHCLMSSCEICANTKAKQKNVTISNGCDEIKVNSGRIYSDNKQLNLKMAKKQSQETVGIICFMKGLVTMSWIFITQKEVMLRPHVLNLRK